MSLNKDISHDEIRKQQLKVEIVDRRLVISVGIDVLGHALEYGVETHYAFDEFKITDPYGFAKDLIHELVVEQEDGTTCVHTMLDKAAAAVVEWTDENIEYKDSWLPLDA